MTSETAPRAQARRGRLHQRRPTRRSACWPGLWVALLLALALPALAAPTDEVRVLIDVSGSMKQNDPQNLRAPALRMLAGLLPPDSRAGVWSFAQYVNALAPVETASRQWQQQTVRSADRIHSRGLYTDIGAALRTATADWREPDPNTRRSLILLTDGMVDVSKQPGANSRARQEVVETILPQLQAAGVNVHTIALSDKADQPLLRQLALETGGAFEQADSAEELQRLFLRLFEKAVARDTLPLEGNRFEVDASISELTLLAFQPADATPARLIAPDGTEFGRDNAPANVRWHRENGYDLVTIAAPAAGGWRLLAQTDPDNRVMIVTDLELQTNTLPNNLIAGERLALEARLTEDGETITRAEFLALTRVQVAQQSADQPPRQWTLEDNGLSGDHRAGDGVFSLPLGPGLGEGEHTVLVQVDGKTFERQRRHSVRVFPSPLAIERQPLPADQGWQLQLTPALDWLDVPSLRIGARVQLPDGGARQLSASEAGPGQWQVAVTGLSPTETYRTVLEVAGTTLDGRDFHVQLPALALSAPAPAGAEPQPAPEPAAEAEAAATPAAEEPPAEAPDINWPFVITIVVVGNIALFGIIGIVFYLLRQRRKPLPTVGDDGGEVPDAVAQA